MPYIDRLHSVAQEPAPKIISGPTKTRRKTQAAEQTYCPKQSTKLNVELIDLQYEIMANPELNAITKAGALAVVLAIARPMKTTGLSSWPSQITIAEITGLSKTFVGKICKILHACGYVSMLPGRAGRGHSARYRFGGTWDEDAISDSLKGMPGDLLAGNSAKIGVLGKPNVSAHLAKIKGRPVVQNSKSKKQPQNPTCTAESATGASPPFEAANLTRSDSGIEADTAPAGLMLRPALNAVGLEFLVTEPCAADDLIQSPACNTDIRDTTSAAQGRLCRDRVEVEEPPETQALAALSSALYVWPVANAANGDTVIDLAGRAARRPETKPHHKGRDDMARIARIQSREEMFAKIKNFYPVIGLDDATNFDALGLVLDHGIDFYELFADVLDQKSFAKEGRDVPPLVEFLVSRCWTEAIAA